MINKINRTNEEERKIKLPYIISRHFKVGTPSTTQLVHVVGGAAAAYTFKEENMYAFSNKKCL